jgi:putative ABC transport system ATP-binding protein
MDLERDSRLPLFALLGVSASRGGRTVLRDLSLKLAPGATAVLGPSGAGKSTLLRLLNRLSDPEDGTVLFRGEDVREIDVLELRRRVCLVPQLPALLPGTVEENVVYGAALAGRPAANVQRSLLFAGLDPGYAGRDAERLSVGEQQRVMLARALALQPEVLLLDEPTSALDHRAKAGVEATLCELVYHLGVSAVVVTHDRAQAARLATKVAELQ